MKVKGVCSMYLKIISCILPPTIGILSILTYMFQLTPIIYAILPYLVVLAVIILTTHITLCCQYKSMVSAIVPKSIDKDKDNNYIDIHHYDGVFRIEGNFKVYNKDIEVGIIDFRNNVIQVPMNVNIRVV